MFGIGPQELVVILVVALLVLGPKRLPELARSMGRAMAEFRRASSDLRQSLSLDDDVRPRRPHGPQQTALGTQATPTKPLDPAEGRTIAPPEGASPAAPGEPTQAASAEGHGPESVPAEKTPSGG